MNEKNNICNFILEDGYNYGIKHTGIDLQDLAVALNVLYNDEIPYKGISFSLDPKNQTDPMGPEMQKVHWPDAELNGKQVIAGTKFGEIMFEADWLMKQLSLGITVKNMIGPILEEKTYP